MKKQLFIVLFLVITVLVNLALMPKVSRPGFERKQKLSEYNFFTGKLADLIPATSVFPYDINSVLFSNYAEKMRFIKLPHGSKAGYKERGALAFPTGTIIIKNFYYENDFRKPGEGRKII